MGENNKVEEKTANICTGTIKKIEKINKNVKIF